MSIVLTNIVFGGGTVTIGTDVGATMDGIVVTREPEFLHIQPDQLTSAAVSFLVSESYTIAFTYLEATLVNLMEAICGLDGDDLVGTTFEVGGVDTPTEHTDMVVYGVGPDSYVRDIAFDRVQAAEPGDYTIGRKDAHKIPGKYRAFGNTDPAHLGRIAVFTDTAP